MAILRQHFWLCVLGVSLHIEILPFHLLGTFTRVSRLFED